MAQVDRTSAFTKGEYFRKREYDLIKKKYDGQFKYLWKLRALDSNM